MPEIMVHNVDGAVVEQLESRAEATADRCRLNSSSSWKTQLGQRLNRFLGPRTAPWWTKFARLPATGPKPTVQRCWQRTGRGEHC